MLSQNYSRFAEAYRHAAFCIYGNQLPTRLFLFCWRQGKRGKGNVRVFGHVSHAFHVRPPRAYGYNSIDCHLIVAPNFEAGFVPQDASARGSVTRRFPKIVAYMHAKLLRVRMQARVMRVDLPCDRSQPGRACTYRHAGVFMCARPEVIARRQDNDNQAQDATRVHRVLK